MTARTRSGKHSRCITFCTVCETEVGVWETPFNRTFKDRVVKTGRHLHGDTGRICAGSLLAIHPNNAWERTP